MNFKGKLVLAMQERKEDRYIYCEKSLVRKDLQKKVNLFASSLATCLKFGKFFRD
jgi:uncharacterized protein YqiB (DUF1249 family)